MIGKGRNGEYHQIVSQLTTKVDNESLRNDECDPQASLRKT